MEIKNITATTTEQEVTFNTKDDFQYNNVLKIYCSADTLISINDNTNYQTYKAEKEETIITINSISSLFVKTSSGTADLKMTKSWVR